MKKVIVLTLLLSVVLTVSAQGEWTKTFVEGDPLKGTETTTVYIYSVPEMGNLVLWDWNTFQFRLTSDNAQFNIQTVYSQYVGNSYGVVAHIGIYDNNDQLLEKINLWLDRENNRGNQFVRTRNAGGMGNPVGQKGKVKKIFKALQSDKGYVRIVAERFNQSDFDIRIKPYKE